MSNPPNSPNPAPPPGQKGSPRYIAANVADYVRAGVTIIAWLIVASVAVGAAWVAIRAVIWACRLATEALGI